MHTLENVHVRELGRYRVRELVCSYRPARDGNGRIVRVSSLALSTPRLAAQVLRPLMADHTVETFGVACLSTRHRFLAWHALSRGTRSSTPVSLPDVFVPACVTPGTVALIVVHNHPSGDPTPSMDDIALTTRLRAASEVLDLALLDHLIVGEHHLYYSFRDAGLLGATPPASVRSRGVCGLSLDSSPPQPTAIPTIAAPTP